MKKTKIDTKFIQTTLNLQLRSLINDHRVCVKRVENHFIDYILIDEQCNREDLDQFDRDWRNK